MIRRTIRYRGTVQGVGFRWTVVQTARGFQVTGSVRNLSDGRVELVAEGDPAQLTAFCDAVAERMAGYIRGTEVSEAPATGQFKGFTVAF